MKLYATVTSERGKEVNKSGNDYLIVKVNDKHREELITLHITCANSHLRGEHYNIYLTNHQDEYIDIGQDNSKSKQRLTQSEKFLEDKNNGSM